MLPDVMLLLYEMLRDPEISSFSLSLSLIINSYYYILVIIITGPRYYVVVVHRNADFAHLTVMLILL